MPRAEACRAVLGQLVGNEPHTSDPQSTDDRCRAEGMRVLGMQHLVFDLLLKPDRRHLFLKRDAIGLAGLWEASSSLIGAMHAEREIEKIDRSIDR